MTPRDRVQYRELRATIRERGTARVWVFVAGLAAWAALATATVALAAPPFATLLPLLVLAATFEAVFGLHVGVERIGRYLQVFYEDSWEQTAMAFSLPLAGTTTDPLFTVFFGLAIIINFVPVMLSAPVPVEIIVFGGAHGLVFVRILLARRTARRQRTADLERFQQLKQRSPADAR